MKYDELDGAHIEMAQAAPETVRRARIVVAANARNAEDCRGLLDALGLLPKSA